mgnify:CR=1 FL=1
MNLYFDINIMKIMKTWKYYDPSPVEPWPAGVQCWCRFFGYSLRDQRNTIAHRIWTRHQGALSPLETRGNVTPRDFRCFHPWLVNIWVCRAYVLPPWSNFIQTSHITIPLRTERKTDNPKKYWYFSSTILTKRLIFLHEFGHSIDMV